MKADLFQSCGHCGVFQIFLYMECSTLTASSFRIRNSSAGIPSSPWALFVVRLPKAHLTSHSRMSGSRWVITPLWLSGLLRSFLYSFFCVFLPPFLNVFCFSQVLAVFLSFIVLIFAGTVSWVSPVFLKRTLVFPILLFPSISLLCSRKSFLSLFAILWNSAFNWVYLSLSPLPSLFFFSQLFVRPP